MKHTPPEHSVPRARQMRRQATEVEKRIWYALRQHWPHMRFRRQVPIAHYIADFASHRLKLVIELDGGQHSVSVDAERSAIITAQGYHIERFWNNDVLHNEDAVLQRLAEVIAARSPKANPSE